MTPLNGNLADSFVSKIFLLIFILELNHFNEK